MTPYTAESGGNSQLQREEAVSRTEHDRDLRIRHILTVTLTNATSETELHRPSGATTEMGVNVPLYGVLSHRVCISLEYK